MEYRILVFPEANNEVNKEERRKREERNKRRLEPQEKMFQGRALEQGKKNKKSGTLFICCPSNIFK